MRKLIFLGGLAIILASCAPTQLYNWNKYEKTSYAYLKKNDADATQDLKESYEKIIKKQNKLRKAVPPGIYADYGFLLIQQGNSTEGKKMFENEIALYPESKVFIDRILKTIEQ